MSFYALHTTKHSERVLLIERGGVEIEVAPQDLQSSTILNRAVVVEEEGKTYVQSTDEFLELCKSLEDPSYDPLESKYYKMYLYKAHDVYTRIMNLRGLIFSIKENGILKPVHVEKTGERLDGSFRTKIAMYLGIPKVKAILHEFNWQDIDEDFIERKLRARELSSGKDYYEFAYGYKDWKNVKEGGEVYRENAERWKTIVPLIEGKTVLDLGCNEGYISIQAARAGFKVVGIDQDWNHIAWLNKLIFEWIDKKEIPVEFIEGDILNTQETADTILLLNVLYHIPRDKQVELLQRFKGKRMIFQCNLRKAEVRDKYYTSHPDDLKALLKEAGFTGGLVQIDYDDKPIIISNGT